MDFISLWLNAHANLLEMIAKQFEKDDNEEGSQKSQVYLGAKDRPQVSQGSDEA